MTEKTITNEGKYLFRDDLHGIDRKADYDLSLVFLAAEIKVLRLQEIRLKYD